MGHYRKAGPGSPGSIMVSFCLGLGLLLTAFVIPCRAQAPAAEKQVAGSGRNQIRVAQDYERRGHHSAALKIYSALFSQVPQNQLYYEGVKRNMLRLKQFEGLADIVRQQINRTNSVRFHADLGNVLYNQGAHEQALKTWSAAIESFKSQKPAYTYVANAMISNRLYDEGIKVYQQGRKIFKSDDLFVFELANIYVLRLKYKEATAEYVKHLARNPNQFAYVERRIMGYTKSEDDATQVIEVLKEQLSRRKESHLVRRLLANLYLRQEQFSLALQQFKLLEETRPPNQKVLDQSGKEIYFFAEKALKAGKFDHAEGAYALILSGYPSSPYRPRAMYGVAVSKQKQGHPREAIALFEAVIARDAKATWAQESLFQVGEIYFDELFETENALAAYQRLARAYPRGRKTTDAFFRIGDCYTATGDLQTAKTWYERAGETLTDNAPLRDLATYKAAYLQFLNGDYSGSLALLGGILDKMGQAGVDQKYVNDALELTLLIEENQKKSAEALAIYARAELLSLQRKPAAAADSLARLLSVHEDAEIVDDALLKLGELANEQGQFLSAVAYLDTLLRRIPDSVHCGLAQKRIAEIYEVGLNSPEKAFAAYENVLINYPNSLYVEEVRQKLRLLQGRQLNN